MDEYTGIVALFVLSCPLCGHEKHVIAPTKSQRFRCDCKRFSAVWLEWPHDEVAELRITVQLGDDLLSSECVDVVEVF